MINNLPLIKNEKILLFFRHYKIFFTYLSLKKVYNIFLCLIHCWLRLSKVASVPFYIKIESTRFCNLRCEGCIHGNPEYKKATIHQQLNLAGFKFIIDPIVDKLSGISFSYLGEPLFCDDIFSMVEYAHSKNIGTMFPSNMSVQLTEEQINQLVLSD